MGNTNTKPFGVKDKIGYMCGDIANDFTFIFASSYVMVFYTKVMGVSAGMVGTMFLLARCLDAFTDIGMGRIVDNSNASHSDVGKCIQTSEWDALLITASRPRTDASVRGFCVCAHLLHWHRS